MITRKLGAALAAGCTAVIKPPPETPFSCLALTEVRFLATTMKMSNGNFVVYSWPAALEYRMASLMLSPLRKMWEKSAKKCVRARLSRKSHSLVLRLWQSSSTECLRPRSKSWLLIYWLALRLTYCSQILRVSIEAGGNAPFIVFGDANIDNAVEGTFKTLVFFMRSNAIPGAIANKFRVTGQTCVCANRIYVQSSVYADFASRLAEKVSTFKVGDGLDEKTYI